MRFLRAVREGDNGDEDIRVNTAILDSEVVLGPEASVDSNLASFDGVKGDALKDSGLAVDADGAMVSPTIKTPTLTAPTIADFSNANHTHAAAGATGGVVDHLNLTSCGNIAHATIDILLANVNKVEKSNLVVGATYPATPGNANCKKVSVTADYLGVGGRLLTNVNVTANYAASGANGLDAPYANLTGTVAIAGTTAVVGTSTLFTTEYVVGDLMVFDPAGTPQIRRITVITDATHITVASAFAGTINGKNHQKRNWLAVHVCSNASGSGACALLSQSATAPTLPAGYVLSRRVGWVRFGEVTANTEEFFRFVHIDDWWWWNEDISAAPFRWSITSSPATTPTDLSWATVAPSTAKIFQLSFYVLSGGDNAGLAAFRSNSMSNLPSAAAGANGTIWGALAGTVTDERSWGETQVPCDSSQVIEYWVDGSTTDLYVSFQAYYDRV